MVLSSHTIGYISGEADVILQLHTFLLQGRIACGESKELYVSFQSSYEGVFSETWHFTTDPPLLSSTTPITLHLFGIAFWPDSCLNGKLGIVEEARAVCYL